MLLNVGPAHPAMHGIIRIVLRLDGETVKGADVEIGYLHRGFEKMCEQGGYNHAIPYTDRLNYVSPLINNVGYCLAIEKLMGLTVPERGQYIRVLMSEISRITDHLTCVGASAMELGAFTVFLYMIKAREYLWELVEMVTGARLTISYCRVGGIKADLPEGFEPRTREALAQGREVLVECDKLLTRNRIFVDRMKGTGKISQQDALAYGITGPFLRSTGVNYDVRKQTPYLVYDRLTFEVPLASTGTTSTAISAGWRRWSRACGSSSSAWPNCRAGRFRPRGSPARRSRRRRWWTRRRWDASRGSPGPTR